MEAGEIFCRDSVRFRSFEDDLINEQQWQQKEELLATTGLTLLKQPIQEHLAALEQRLEERIERVNQRITAGENEHFQIKRQGQQVRWPLHYPGNSKPLNPPFLMRCNRSRAVVSCILSINSATFWQPLRMSYHVMRNN